MARGSLPLRGLGVIGMAACGGIGFLAGSFWRSQASSPPVQATLSRWEPTAYETPDPDADFERALRKIEQIEKLKVRGALSLHEFEAEKRRILKHQAR